VEEGRFPVAEGLQGDLGRAPAEEGALFAQDFPFHEADVGAAENQEDVARAAPGTVPPLLEEGGQLGAGLDHPLEFVEGEDELAVRFPAGPAGDDGVEGGARREPGWGGVAGRVLLLAGCARCTRDVRCGAHSASDLVND
jgi:hypothetical protein